MFAWCLSEKINLDSVKICGCFRVLKGVFSVSESKTTSKALTSYHHGNLKKALVKAACETLDEFGYEGFTLRKCAKKAGVSPAAPSHHFSSASDLMAVVASESLTQLTRRIKESYSKCTGVGTSKTRLIGDTYLSFAKEYPARYQAIFGAKINSKNEEFTDSLKRFFDESAQLLQEIYPEDSKKAIEAAVLRMWSLLHGFSTLSQDGRLSFLEKSSSLVTDSSVEEAFVNTLNLERARCSDIY